MTYRELHCEYMNWIQRAEGCIMAGFNIIMSLYGFLFVICLVIWLRNQLAKCDWRLFAWFVDKLGRLASWMHREYQNLCL